MSRRTIQFILGLALLSGSGCNREDDPQPQSDPRGVEIVTSDVDLFWKVYDSNPGRSGEVFLNQYFNAGTEALRLFYEGKVQKVSRLTNALNNEVYRSYYESIRANTLSLGQDKESIYVAFERLKSIYDNAVYSDVVFVIGALNTGGTVVRNGQMVIGSELFCKSHHSDISGFNPWLKSVVRSREHMKAIVVHELMHVQQINFARQAGIRRGNTLLEGSLMEGTADFVAYVVTGQNFNDHIHEYANPREKELWLQFKAVMTGTSYAGWLYNGGSGTDTRPADLGYYIGFKIAEELYNRAADKKEAIRQILEISHPVEFLEKSGYTQKF